MAHQDMSKERRSSKIALKIEHPKSQGQQFQAGEQELFLTAVVHGCNIETRAVLGTHIQRVSVRTGNTFSAGPELDELPGICAYYLVKYDSQIRRGLGQPQDTQAVAFQDGLDRLQQELAAYIATHDAREDGMRLRARATPVRRAGGDDELPEHKFDDLTRAQREEIADAVAVAVPSGKVAAMILRASSYDDLLSRVILSNMDAQSVWHLCERVICTAFNKVAESNDALTYLAINDDGTTRTADEYFDLIYQHLARAASRHRLRNHKKLMKRHWEKFTATSDIRTWGAKYVRLHALLVQMCAHHPDEGYVVPDLVSKAEDLHMRAETDPRFCSGSDPLFAAGGKHFKLRRFTVDRTTEQVHDSKTL